MGSQACFFQQALVAASWTSRDLRVQNICFPMLYKVRSAAAEILLVPRLFAVVPAERPLELNSKGKLTLLVIFKGLQCKKIVM